MEEDAIYELQYKRIKDDKWSLHSAYKTVMEAYVVHDTLVLKQKKNILHRLLKYEYRVMKIK